MQEEWSNFNGVNKMLKIQLRVSMYSLMMPSLKRLNRAKIEFIYLRWNILNKDTFTGCKMMMKVKKRTRKMLWKFITVSTILKCLETTNQVLLKVSQMPLRVHQWHHKIQVCKVNKIWWTNSYNRCKMKQTRRKKIHHLVSQQL